MRARAGLVLYVCPYGQVVQGSPRHGGGLGMGGVGWGILEYA